MAELSTGEVYRILLGSRIRSQLAYRTSFWLNVATSVGIGLVEFIEIYAIFSNVAVFGGLNLRQSALVFALGNMGFALADTIFGQLDTIPSYLRMGRLEVLLARPMPLLLQLVTSEVQLRRLGRLAVGVVILIIVLPGLTSPTPLARPTCSRSPRLSERPSMVPSSPWLVACSSSSSTGPSSPRHSSTAAPMRVSSPVAC